MAIVTTDNRYYSEIATAIREKTGGSAEYMPSQMAAAIRGIQGGEAMSVETIRTICYTPPVLLGIAVTSVPTKTEYDVGDVFDPSGMVVVATYTKGISKVIADYTFTPGGSLSLETTKVTISYTDNGVTATTTQEITVKEPSVIINVSGTLQSSYAYVQLTSTSKATSATTVEIKLADIVKGYPKVYVSSPRASSAMSCTITLNGATVATGSSDGADYAIDITNCRTVNIVFSSAGSGNYVYYSCAITTT